ncbi:MAG: hypothetical protein EXR48_02030 [Dehalococcoidia bacterium]|nr:hypothetical protein [Dehalococcoidia bacterium]
METKPSRKGAPNEGAAASPAATPQRAGGIGGTSQEAVLGLLQEGQITSCSAIPRGTNYTFRVSLRAQDGASCEAIYKPRDGENPLWDFPQGTLHLRERATYLLAEALGWCFVPPTVVREGPYGPGSVQLHIKHEPDCHYFTIREQHIPDFQRMALFDWLANNADRKAGHCLLSPDGKVWGIDHGLTFNVAPKLRTVIWDVAGQPVPALLLADVERLGDVLSPLQGPLVELSKLLSNHELSALRKRRETILSRRCYPETHEGGVPWPWL